MVLTMYTAIRRKDGRFRFALHVPPGEMRAEEARRALAALAELREVLEDAAGLCVRGSVPHRPFGPEAREGKGALTG